MLQTLTKIDYAIDHCTGNAKCYTCSKCYTYMSLLFFEQNKTNRSVSFMYASVLICFFLYTHTHTLYYLLSISLSFFLLFLILTFHFMYFISIPLSIFIICKHLFPFICWSPCDQLILNQFSTILRVNRQVAKIKRQTKICHGLYEC